MSEQRPHVRDERWTRDGQAAAVSVLGQPGVSGEGAEIVEVSYELLAQMLGDLGFTRDESEGL